MLCHLFQVGHVHVWSELTWRPRWCAWLWRSLPAACRVNPAHREWRGSDSDRNGCASRCEHTQSHPVIITQLSLIYSKITNVCVECLPAQHLCEAELGLQQSAQMLQTQTLQHLNQTLIIRVKLRRVWNTHTHTHLSGDFEWMINPITQTLTNLFAFFVMN